MNCQDVETVPFQIIRQTWVRHDGPPLHFGVLFFEEAQKLGSKGLTPLPVGTHEVVSPRRVTKSSSVC
jgi:hypothetical protein